VPQWICAEAGCNGDRLMTSIHTNPHLRVFPGRRGAATVLVVAANAAERERLAAALSEYNCITVPTAHDAELVLAAGGVAVVVVATDLEDMPGLEWLGQLRRRNQTVMRLFAPTESREDLAIAAVNIAGVFRYIRNATEEGLLARAVAEALEVSGHRSGPPCMRESVAKAIKAHSQCRTSTEGCLVQEQQDLAQFHKGFLQRVSSQVGWTGMGILSLAIFLISVLLMGIGVFTILYILKSSLGFDLISNMHLHDWFAH